MTQDVKDIWQKVHRGLRTFIARRVANDAEVEDLLQEVFLRMHRRLESLKDPSRLVSWVFQITRHAIADHYRATERQREVPAGLAADMDAAFPTPSPSPTRQSPTPVSFVRNWLPAFVRWSSSYPLTLGKRSRLLNWKA